MSIFPFILTSKPPAFNSVLGLYSITKLGRTSEGYCPQSVCRSDWRIGNQCCLAVVLLVYPPGVIQHSSTIAALIISSVCVGGVYKQSSHWRIVNFAAQNDFLVFCFCTRSTVWTHFTFRLSMIVNSCVSRSQCARNVSWDENLQRITATHLISVFINYEISVISDLSLIKSIISIFTVLCREMFIRV